MIKKNKIELVYLRTFTCMIIIVTHLLTQLTLEHEHLDEKSLQFLYYLRNFIIFGTPGFIMLSQLLTTLNYKQVNIQYLIKRFKYIFIPYLIMGTFYSYSEALYTDSSFKHQFLENVVLGQWYGYFILIIMQFFILSYIIYKINHKLFNSKILLIVSFIVQQTFLYFFNSHEQFHDIFLHYYPLSENTFILGWIFYFFVGGFIGYHYQTVLSFLQNYIVIVITLAAIAYIVFITAYPHDYWNVTSFTDTLTVFNVLMFLLLLGVCIHFNELMYNSVAIVSAFSFFIYLLHPIILDSLFKYTSIFEHHTVIFLAISLLLVLGICIGVGTLLKEFKIFRFVMGKQPYNYYMNVTRTNNAIDKNERSA